MSTLAQILDAVTADHEAAARTVGGQALTVVKRKLPKREEVDAPYSVTVSAAEQSDRTQRIAFGSVFMVVYRVEMTLVVPNDRDQATNLDDVTDWREATRARYMRPHPIPVAQVKRVEIVDGALLDRPLLTEGYDFSQLVIDVTTYETRSGS